MTPRRRNSKQAPSDAFLCPNKQYSPFQALALIHQHQREVNNLIVFRIRPKFISVLLAHLNPQGELIKGFGEIDLAEEDYFDLKKSVLNRNPRIQIKERLDADRST